MQLLEKRQIDGLKAKERQQEIQEGKKLAEKVDALRELASREQTNLSKFTEESVAHLKAEIGTLIDDKEALKTEIRELELQKSIAQVPLDNKWAEFHEKQSELESLGIELHEKQRQITQKEAEADKRLRDLSVESSRVSDEHARISEVLSQTDRLKKEADTTVQDARNQAATVHLTAEFRDNTSRDRENRLNISEKSLKESEEAIHIHTKDLEDRERALQDKYETLIRTQERIKHGRKRKQG